LALNVCGGQAVDLDQDPSEQNIDEASRFVMEAATTLFCTAEGCDDGPALATPPHDRLRGSERGEQWAGDQSRLLARAVWGCALSAALERTDLHVAAQHEHQLIRR
jgi:hypothetical protein